MGGRLNVIGLEKGDLQNFFLMGVQRWTCTSHLHIAWDTQSVGIARTRIKTERLIVYCLAYRVFRTYSCLSIVALQIHKHLVIDAVAEVALSLDDLLERVLLSRIAAEIDKLLEVEISVKVIGVNHCITTCNVTLQTSDSVAAGCPRAHRCVSFVTSQAVGWQAAAGTRHVASSAAMLASRAWNLVDVNDCTLYRKLVVALAHVEKALDALVQRTSDLDVSSLKHFCQQIVDLDHPLHDLALVGGGSEGIERFCAGVAPLDGVGAAVEFAGLLGDG